MEYYGINMHNDYSMSDCTTYLNIHNILNRHGMNVSIINDMTNKQLFNLLKELKGRDRENSKLLIKSYFKLASKLSFIDIHKRLTLYSTYNDSPIFKRVESVYFISQGWNLFRLDEEYILLGNTIGSMRSYNTSGGHNRYGCHYCSKVITDRYAYHIHFDDHYLKNINDFIMNNNMRFNKYGLKTYESRFHKECLDNYFINFIEHWILQIGKSLSNELCYKLHMLLSYLNIDIIGIILDFYVNINSNIGMLKG